MERRPQQFGEPRDGILPIQILAAGNLRGYLQHSVFVDSRSQPGTNPTSLLRREGCCTLQVEPERHAARYLVHVLAAGASAARRHKLQIAFGDLQISKNRNQWRS